MARKKQNIFSLLKWVYQYSFGKKKLSHYYREKFICNSRAVMFLFLTTIYSIQKYEIWTPISKKKQQKNNNNTATTICFQDSWEYLYILTQSLFFSVNIILSYNMLKSYLVIRLASNV